MEKLIPNRMRYIVSLLAISLLAACAQQNAVPDLAAQNLTQAAEAERLNAWFQVKFEEDLERFPQYKTYLGMTDDLVA